MPRSNLHHAELLHHNLKVHIEDTFDYKLERESTEASCGN